jgi:Ca2+-binding RTX toxin-like protein
MNTVATANSLVSASFVSAALNSLVVFDSRLSDLDVLYGALLPGAIGHTIGATEDALVVITRLLAETGATKLSIVAHGEPGVVHIGAQPLNLSQLAARSGLLQEWCLDEVALFSCEVGADVEFVGQLAQATGAAVFAANTKVGAAALGGTWNLAVQSGEQEMTVPWSIADLAGYQAVLAIVPATTGVDNFTGTGNPGDTSALPDTITITNPNQINSGDNFNGGGGTDEISLTAGAFNFSGVLISNVEDLISDGSNTVQSVTLTAAQFASFTNINLGNDNDTLTINVSGLTNISALGNPTITNVENIFLTGTGLNDTITLTGAQLNSILLSATGTSSIDLGNGLDTINLTANSTGLNGLSDAALQGVEVISGSTALASININLASQTSEAFQIIGSGFGDSIVGGALSDIITGGAGPDTIIGGDGDDQFIGFDGFDSIDGGLGTDTIKLTTNLFNLNGALDSEITGVEVVDASTAVGPVNIDLSAQAGLGEAFKIIGTGNSIGDTLRGSAGADSIEGGNGNDQIVGFVGDDTVNGGSGTGDTIVLNATSINFNNASDSQLDRVEVIDASSSLTGVAIDIKNQVEGFTVIGSGSNDTITGSSAADILSGGSGNDDYIGFVGADVINDSACVADKIVLSATSNDLNIASNTQIVGIELVDASTAIAGVEINLGVQVEGLNVTGSNFNDTLTGGLGTNVISGGTGNDIINNFGGSDTVDGGGNTDTLNVVANLTATDVQILNVENISAARATSGVILNLAPQSEVLNITGSVYADTITGGGNNDTINGFEGADIINGSGGVNTLNLTATSIDLNTISGILSDARIVNIQAVTAANATAGVLLNLASQSEGFAITGSGFADTITGSTGIDNISSGLGDDVINGFTTTGAGDTVNGGTGNDTLNVTANLVATDAQVTSIENVSAAGASVGVSIDLGNQLTEGFVVTGSLQNDTITGGGGADNINGSGGNDVIVGFTGADTVNGGAGTNNTIQLQTNSTDLNSASDARITSIQTIDASAGFGSFDINLSNQTEGFKVLGSNSADTITGGIGADSISSGNGADVINGFVGNDTVDGGTGIDVIKLTATSAELNAASDAQVVNIEVVDASGAAAAVNVNLLNQSEGFVTVTGSAFSDTIFGSSGNDLIIGGDGNDTISFDGIDTIQGGLGTDVITVASSLNTFNDAQIDSVDVITAAAALGSVTINVANQTEGLTIIGSNFADNLTGAIGNDTINAGGGNDTINGWSGDNTVNGGAGSDSVNLTTTSFTFNLALDSELVDVEAITTNGASGPVNISLVNQTEGFTVTGTSFAETITGGKGNDTIVGFVGSDTVNGGTPNLPSVTGGFDTIALTGTSSDLNNIALTSPSAIAADARIVNIEAVSAAAATSAVEIKLDHQTEGFAITGSGQSDTITGGAGADNISSGAGDDAINGFVGADTVDGGTGANSLNLTATSLTLNAATNAQLLNVQTVNLLNSANVNLANQTESLTINGSIGSDTIRGGSGADSILAGDGSDFIEEFIGADTVDGGSSVLPLVSTDTLRITATSTALNNATNAQLLNVEVVSAAGATAGVNLNLSNQSEGFATIVGSGFSDTITGSTGTDFINAGNGNDTIVGFDGSDTVNGGGGVDSIRLNATSITFDNALDGQIVGVEEITVDLAAAGVAIDLTGQTENFLVRGSLFADTITGGNGGGGDDIRAGFGDDIIIGFEGDDSVDGGAGTGDVIKLMATSADLNSTSLGNPGNIIIAAEASHDLEIQGVEIISAADAAAGVVVNLDVQSEAFKIIGSAQDDTLQGGIGNDTIDGGAGAEDFAVFDGFRTDYNIERIDSGANTSWVVTDNLPLVNGNDGTDTLTNIENLQFNQGSPFQLIVDRLIGSLGDDNSGTNEVLKNSANGTVVGLTAAAIDGDLQTVTYSLTNNAGGRFAIDATTGVVTVANSTLINAAATYSVTVKATSGDASFTSKAFSIDVKDSITPPPTPAVRNDFDGDGTSDILFKNIDTRIVNWKIAGGPSGPSIQSSNLIDSLSNDWVIREAADFGGDKKSDILFRNSIDGRIVLWQMGGANGSTVQSSSLVDTLSNEWAISAAADLDGDKKSDIVFRNTLDGRISIWKMNGSTVVSSTPVAALSNDWVIQDAGDFNGDQKSDILFRNSTDGRIVLWKMDGSTVLSSTLVDTLSNDWAIKGVDDFDGDQKSDILFRNTLDGRIAIWKMNDSTVLSSNLVDTLSLDWSIAGTGDFGGDQRSDILLRNNLDGRVVTWEMGGVNGNVVQRSTFVSPLSNSWSVANT